MLCHNRSPLAITAFTFLDAASWQLPVTNRKKCGDYYTRMKIPCRGCLSRPNAVSHKQNQPGGAHTHRAGLSHDDTVILIGNQLTPRLCGA